MSRQERTTAIYPQVIRWIVIGLLLASAVVLGFPPDAVTSTLTNLVSIRSLRAVGFLSRLWLLSAPVGGS
jgi:uncharacterized membrane protein YraQ (UPF0718 family)